MRQKTFPIWAVVIIVILLAAFSCVEAAMEIDSIYAQETTYRSFTIRIDYTGAGTPSGVVLEYALSGDDTTWVRIDSVTADVGTPDTVQAGKSPLTLIPSTAYLCRVEVTDADETDTSDILEVTTSDYPYPTDWDQIKKNRMPTKDGISGGDTYTTAAYTFTGNSFYLRGLKKIGIKVNLFGLDDNYTFDSISVYLQSKVWGAWNSIATLVSLDIDTLTTAVKNATTWYALYDSTNVATTFLRTFGDSARIYVVVSDSSVASFSDSTLDKRGFGYAIDFVKDE